MLAVGDKLLFIHGENSRDISSRNITVMLYLGALWFYISTTRAFREFEAISHAPLSRDTLFFHI